MIIMAICNFNIIYKDCSWQVLNNLSHGVSLKKTISELLEFVENFQETSKFVAIYYEF
jgi:hypothetical protein